MPRFLALYMGEPEGAPRKPPPTDTAVIAQGMAAWTAWMDRHADKVVETGGPLGVTKETGPDGVADTSNRVAGYVVIEAETHQAAAEMFLNHPHFAIFPGHSVQVMPVQPIPTAP